MPSTHVAAEFERAASALVGRLRRFDPNRIILFGSFARGDAHEGSDLDVLVVLSEGTPITAETPVAMRVAIGPLALDYDLFVTSVSDLESRSQLVGCIEYPAVREGVVLYERGK
jgi:UTP:GlnB (protein PII) uridylyltransferase